MIKFLLGLKKKWMLNKLSTYLKVSPLVLIVIYNLYLRFTYPELTETQLFLKMIGFF